MNAEQKDGGNIGKEANCPKCKGMGGTYYDNYRGCSFCFGTGKVNAVPAPSPGLSAEKDKVPDVSSDTIFIEHIRKHLSVGEVVVCKICGKSAYQIIGEVRYGKHD